jgi:Flp pilus assembly CpaF family ATPase
VFVERHGVLERVAASFQDDRHLLRVIDRIVSASGGASTTARRWSTRACRTVHVSTRSSRRSRSTGAVVDSAVSAERLKSDDLVTLRALTRPMLEFLSHCVKARLNGLISGGTGAGKTTLLNVLSSFISEHERIVTIEDAAELQLHQDHVARLETRPPNIEGKGAVRQRQLMINALRMRPDRIVVGEVRGEEALDMLQAMNTGHDGSLTTIHANTPRDALTRIETMIAMGATNLPERAMRQQIASAIQFVVQQTRLSDGSRKITSISEITGMEGDSSPCRRFSCSKDGHHAGRQGHRPVPGHRRAPEVLRAAEGVGHSPAGGHVLWRHGGAVMLAAFMVFVLVVGAIMGTYIAMMRVPGMLAARRLDRRLLDISMPAATDPSATDDSVVKQARKGPAAGARSAARAVGHGIAAGAADRPVRRADDAERRRRHEPCRGNGRLPSRVIVRSQPFAAPLAGLVAATAPFGLLVRRRSARQKRFEEQFPEALDLLGTRHPRGHAFRPRSAWWPTSSPIRSARSSRRPSISRTTACRCVTR